MIQNQAFFEDLTKMKFGELVMWLRHTLHWAYVDKQVNPAAVEVLYSDFMEAMGATTERVAEYPLEQADVLVRNAPVFRWDIYKKAVIAAHRPMPSYWVQTETMPPVSISKMVSEQCEKRSMTAMRAVGGTWRNQVETYVSEIQKVFRHGAEYRKALRTFISKKNVQQGCILYKLPTRIKSLEKMDIDTVLTKLRTCSVQDDVKTMAALRKKDKERMVNDADEETCYGGLGEMADYGINRMVWSRYQRGGEVEKTHFIRLAFFLGLNSNLAETLLNMEGFTLEKSIKKTDVLLRDCFHIGFSFELASTLLFRKTGKGLR